MRSRKNEVSQVKRFRFSKAHFWVRDDKKNVIVQVFARFGEISGLVWSLHGYFGSTYGLAKIQNHGSSKLALMFYRIEQKSARLHISIVLYCIILYYIVLYCIILDHILLQHTHQLLSKDRRTADGDREAGAVTEGRAQPRLFPVPSTNN